MICLIRVSCYFKTTIIVYRKPRNRACKVHIYAYRMDEKLTAKLTKGVSPPQYETKMCYEYNTCEGHAVAQLVKALRYNRKVASSIPDGVIRFFHWHNFSGRTMALGLTRALTEMSTRNVSWGQRRPVLRADNLTTFMYRLSWNLGTSTSCNTQGL